MKRRLAAILSADVAGYSRLMGNDEEATIAALESRRGISRDRIAVHGGRVVDTAGDSVLAVFDSVVEAVRCAATIQQRVIAANAPLPDARRMQFRIGINLGDVVEKCDGLPYGDGVNDAARVAALALPGGIAVSEDAYRQVDGRHAPANSSTPRSGSTPSAVTSCCISWVFAISCSGTMRPRRPR